MDSSVAAIDIQDRTFSQLPPVGSILAFAGRIDEEHPLPERWLVCNGDSLDRQRFEELWQAIGESWGPGNGPDTFSLPDLRGLFLRGISGPRADSWADPNSGTRTAFAPGANAGNSVGSLQRDTLQRHRHEQEPHRHVYDDTENSDQQAAAGGGDVRYCMKNARLRSPAPTTAWATNAAGRPPLISEPTGTDGNVEIRVADENRPKNAYVYWIIRVK